MPSAFERSEEGVGPPATGVTDSFEPPHGCWEPNPRPSAGATIALNP